MATGKAGSIVFFDGRLWHRTGQNLTDEPRIGAVDLLRRPAIQAE
ncbi:phytanoyl-CoA dioxygenase family protein [Bradyrhizobium sp. RT3b]